MLLSIKNVGRVSEASIELKGITVVAGENDTGKSTLGKVLFCIFNSLYRIDKQIQEEREDAITNTIARTYHETASRTIRRFSFQKIAQDIVTERQQLIQNSDELIKKLKAFYLSQDKAFKRYIEDEMLVGISNRIIELLKISDKEITANVLRKRFFEEFNMQIAHINTPKDPSCITLKIKDKTVHVDVTENAVIKIKDPINIFTELIYIDDPFVLDTLGNLPYYYMRNSNHRSHLRSKLMILESEATGQNTIEEIVAAKKLDKIFNKLKTVCDGELVHKDSTNIAYKAGKLKDTLDFSNLSTGLKTFVILRTLLTNGGLTENGTIVLDEPEIHLHPEWQLVFAEIIVLIQKEFGMHILINTHSPYFLNAIEVYAAKYDIVNKCKYYLAENQGEKSTIKDVSDNIEKIYEKLARPLQDLENERYRYD